MKNLKQFLSALLLIGILSFGLAAYFNISPLPILAALTCLSFALSFTELPKNVFGFNLLVQMFNDEITKGLFPSNEFYKNAKDDSGYINANQVNLPQKGAAPNVQVNRTIFPAQSSQRTDTASGYTLQEFSTDPMMIQDSEALVVSYDKRASILEDHIDNLNTAMANYLGIAWAPTLSTNITVTTGATRAAGATGATGTRKALTKADLITAMTTLDRQNVPQDGRCALVTPGLYGDILNVTSFTDEYAFGQPALPSADIQKLLNFKMFRRSNAPVYSEVQALRAYGAAANVKDCESIIFWHPKFVRKAEGAVQVFERIKDPLYYGDIYSALVRFGGTQARSDGSGIVGLVETWVS